MKFAKTSFVDTYEGLQGTVSFMEEQVAVAMLGSHSSARMADGSGTPSEHIERLKQILVIVKEGIIFFEQHWIHKSGKKEGEVIKFQWFNPKHWNLIGKSTKYYADMWARIFDLYKRNAG